MTTTWIWGDLDDMIFADCDWEISQRQRPPMRTPRHVRGILLFMGIFSSHFDGLRPVHIDSKTHPCVPGAKTRGDGGAVSVFLQF